MFDSFRKFLSEASEGGAHPIRFEHDDYRLAAAEHDAIDLYHFTRAINRSLDEDGRRRVVEMMWEIAYADGRVDDFESNLIWRVADLLGISSRERIELGQRVANRLGITPT